jgi:hypothetical protein
MGKQSFICIQNTENPSVYISKSTEVSYILHISGHTCEYTIPLPSTNAKEDYFSSCVASLLAKIITDAKMESFK